MAPAVVSRDRMPCGHLVQVMDIQDASVTDLGIVEELPFDPRAWRSLFSPLLELFHDTVDRDELDLEWITNQHAVQEGFALGVVVTIDETRNDGHLLRVKNRRITAGEISDVGIAADRLESASLNGKRLRAWQLGIDRVDIRIDDDDVGCRRPRR